MKNALGYKSQVTLALVGLIYITGCSNSKDDGSVKGEDSQAAQEVIQMSQYNVNKYPLNKLVCDPFGQTESDPGTVVGTDVIKHGVTAELFYRSAGQPRYYSVGDYINKTTKADQNLFFTDINAPSRSFSKGFSTKTSAVVKNDAGEKLIEYFALKMKTDLTLREDQEEGLYELAVLSDDGVIVKATISGVQKNIISNDGDHPVKMGCSSQLLDLKRGQRIPLEVQYYQGPRYHIANVLMMRKSTEAGKDSLCGVYGTDIFFSGYTGVPLASYDSLLARGWAPLLPENYVIPQDENSASSAPGGVSNESYNPCASGTNPVVSSFQITDIGIVDAKLSWKTDIASTSQVLVTNALTGVVVLTLSDNQLRLDHDQMLTGLSPNTEYKVKAVSISDDLGKTISEELTFKTKVLQQ